MIAAVCPGTYYAIILVQVDPILRASFVVGLIGIGRKVCWAIAALIKLFTMWPFIADAIDTYRKEGLKVLLCAVAPAAVIVGVLIIYGGIICGWDSYNIWVGDILPTLSQGNFLPSNVSLSFLVLRLARVIGWHYAGGSLPHLAQLWLTVASVIVPVVTLWLSRNCSTRERCVYVMTAAILSAPICWIGYLPLLLRLGAVKIRPWLSSFIETNENGKGLITI